MNEGELQKRILYMRDSMCFCGGEIDDENDPNYRPFKSCKTKRKPTEEEIKQALDEAKKEFPWLEGFIINHPELNGGQVIIEQCLMAQEKWFLKWFGDT